MIELNLPRGGKTVLTSFWLKRPFVPNDLTDDGYELVLLTLSPPIRASISLAVTGRFLDPDGKTTDDGETVHPKAAPLFFSPPSGSKPSARHSWFLFPVFAGFRKFELTVTAQEGAEIGEPCLIQFDASSEMEAVSNAYCTLAEGDDRPVVLPMGDISAWPFGRLKSPIRNADSSVAPSRFLPPPQSSRFEIGLYRDAENRGPGRQIIVKWPVSSSRRNSHSMQAGSMTQPIPLDHVFVSQVFVIRNDLLEPYDGILGLVPARQRQSDALESTTLSYRNGEAIYHHNRITPGDIIAVLPAFDMEQLDVQHRNTDGYYSKYKIDGPAKQEPPFDQFRLFEVSSQFNLLPLKENFELEKNFENILSANGEKRLGPRAREQGIVKNILSELAAKKAHDHPGMRLPIALFEDIYVEAMEHRCTNPTDLLLSLAQIAKLRDFCSDSEDDDDTADTDDDQTGFSTLDLEAFLDPTRPGFFPRLSSPLLPLLKDNEELAKAVKQQNRGNPTFDGDQPLDTSLQTMLETIAPVDMVLGDQWLARATSDEKVAMAWALTNDKSGIAKGLVEISAAVTFGDIRVHGPAAIAKGLTDLADLAKDRILAGLLARQLFLEKRPDTDSVEPARDRFASWLECTIRRAFQEELLPMGFVLAALRGKSFEKLTAALDTLRKIDTKGLLDDLEPIAIKSESDKSPQQLILDIREIGAPETGDVKLDDWPLAALELLLLLSQEYEKLSPDREEATSYPDDTDAPESDFANIATKSRKSLFSTDVGQTDLGKEMQKRYNATPSDKPEEEKIAEISKELITRIERTRAQIEAIKKNIDSLWPTEGQPSTGQDLWKADIDSIWQSEERKKLSRFMIAPKHAPYIFEEIPEIERKLALANELYGQLVKIYDRAKNNLRQ